MTRIKPFVPEELDAEEVRERIKALRVVRSSHIDDVARVKGRPAWEKVKGFIENKPERLERAVSSHSGRTILFYYASSKYNLRVVARMTEKDLYVISFNWLKKKFKSRFKRQIPEGRRQK